MTASQPRGVIIDTGLGNWPPALLMRTSMRSKRSSTCPTNAATCSGSRMSQVAPRTRSAGTPSSASTFFAASTLSSLRPQRATLAPSEAASRAAVRPMPLPPPVMTIT